MQRHSGHNHDPSRRRSLLPFLVVLLAVLLAHATSARPAGAAVPPSPSVDLRQHPLAGEAPVEVSLGLYVTNLVAIDENRETFEVSGYLFGKWLDPRLIAPAGAPVREFKLDQLWTPAIESENSISHKTHSYTLQADASGAVTYTEHFDAVLSTALNLRAFPFDEQVLRFEYQPFLSESSEFRFAREALPGTALSSGKYADLSAWSVGGLRYTTDETSAARPGGESNRAIFEITAKRRGGFYVWKVFIPLLIMTLLPMVVFFIDVKDIDWMLKVPMTMLLSTVAFEFVVARDLPKIGYLTLLDAVFLLSLVFYSICSAEIVYVYTLQATGRRQQAERLHTSGRRVYPAVYLIAFVLILVYFLK
jgi:hypothetical protein